MKLLFVIEWNYGSFTDPDWQPICWIRPKGPGYNSRMAFGDMEMAEKLRERLWGKYDDKSRVVEYVRK